MGSRTFNSIFRNDQKQRLLTALRLRTILLTLSAAVLISLVLIFIFSNNKKAIAATETLSSGAFIINMGVTPQTYNNGLKPYGMLYDLIVNHSVPIKWVIEPTKVKDGTDFTYSGTNYKGGPFIIPVEYINSTIQGRITYWQTQGVQGVYTNAPISVPVYTTLTDFPVAIIDNQANKQSIITGYYTNAAIPSAGYVVGTPSGLQACNDIWVNPHGDPTWVSHGYLYNYVTVSKNFIWAECHAVSVMEGIQNPSPPNERLNFLTTNGLKCYSNGKCVTGIEVHGNNPTTPYTHNYPADPMMQFMGTMDGACNSGSEQWYQPQVAGSGQWRATTKRLVTTSDGVSPNEGILMVYGPGFGNVNNGYVMYEAGHDLDGSGTTAEKVAAQRAYFNYVLFAGITKQLTFSTFIVPGSFKSSEVKQVTATVTPGAGTAPYTYTWSSSVGGSFSSVNAATTNYTAPNTPVAITGAVKCTVLDACGRQSFNTQIIAVSENTLPIELKSFTAKEVNGDVEVDWVTASEVNNAYFTIERSRNGIDFNQIGQREGAGNSTQDIHYSFIDNEPENGANYYRLIQTDFDGKFKIYPAVFVKISSQKLLHNDILKLSPIPFSDHIKIDFYQKESGNINFIILNEVGKLVKSETVNVSEGFNFYTFDNLSLPSGVYFIIMKTDSGEMISRKVLNF